MLFERKELVIYGPTDYFTALGLLAQNKYIIYVL